VKFAEIVPHNPLWKEEFLSIKAAMAEKLGDAVIQIDHIGSTAVEGLDAKDCIDIQITVKSLGQLDKVIEGLTALGYLYRAHNNRDHVPPGWQGDSANWDKRYFRAGEGQRRTNIHVRQLGMENQRYALLFRDYLCANKQVALIYAALKRVISQYHSEDIEAYCLIKDPACDLIMDAAYCWASNQASLNGRTGSS
jgi:GrpB-like predicted nucleotidyltransferase (UPF0157 family)